MPNGTGHAHVMMYSHDTFGLGHLRRSRAVAHAIVERLKQSNVMIVSGSAIAGAFDLRARVDFIKIPSVIKLYNGDYTSLSEHIDLADTLRMRRAILQSTAEIYRPDVFIVDKEPLGLRGELEPTLNLLKAAGCRLVLGLREVLDGPELLREEWRRSNALAHIDRLYDEIWVYGCETFWNPLTGLDVPDRIRKRMRFMGYLERNMPGSPSDNLPKLPERYILVTAGGGGDGAVMMDQVLAAREVTPGLDAAIVMVLGPFMRVEDRDMIKQRAGRIGGIVVIDFDARVESLMAGAEAIVSMGGYNTFCEILSFDKPALLIPRTEPRQEQLVRAERAAALDLVDMLTPEAADDPATLGRALVRLLSRQPPSQSRTPVDLGGLRRVSDRVESLVGETVSDRRALIGA
jgi:predicted glycosyltransferase